MQTNAAVAECGLTGIGGSKYGGQVIVSRRPWLRPLIVAVLLTGLLHASVRLLTAVQIDAPDVKQIHGLAYAPYGDGLDPLAGDVVPTERIAADLEHLAPLSPRLRTYGVRAGLELIVELGAKRDMDVLPGAWLGPDEVENRAEIEALVALAARHPELPRLLVGNEAIHRGDLAVADIVALLAEVRARTGRLVSTSETWDVWLAHPELAVAVDYIAVHVLPYWEGVPAGGALALAQRRIAEIKARFPTKPVVVTEIGWPSGGGRIRAARPDPVSQQRFLREFVAHADASGLEYYWMEAIDQPWKAAQEDAVGAYWGLLNEDRAPKYPLTGPIPADPAWAAKTAIAIALASGLLLLAGRLTAPLSYAGALLLAASTHMVALVAVEALAAVLAVYLQPWELLALLLLAPALVLLSASLLAVSFEVAEAVLSARHLQRAGPAPVPAAGPWPKVAIFVPCANEPVEIVIETMDALARLDYPDFRVHVVINNTADPALVEPVKAHGVALGDRFDVIDLGNIDGYKGSALALTRDQMNPAAQIYALIDADYSVAPNWLRELAGHFADPQVGFVQAPQAHRAAHGRYAALIDAESDAFFRIGMHHRQQRNALIQHGTMTLIRVAALDAVGGWSSASVVEDTELGLRLHAGGWRGVYVDQVYGRGLLPATVQALKNQRQRWAYGAVQILRTHWPVLLGRSALSFGQRYHYLSGWLGWFAQALQLPFALLAIAWTIGLLLYPRGFDLPWPALVAPALVAIAWRGLLGLWGLRARVVQNWRDSLGVAMVAMGLSHTVARGIWRGLFAVRIGFITTTKGQRRATDHTLDAVREELGLAAALLLAAIAVGLQPDLRAGPDAWWWIAFLLTLSLPYLCAVRLALLARRG